MEILKRFEDMLERKIDGFFNRKLSGRLKIEEIAAKLQRAADDSRVAENGVDYIADIYKIYINEDDYVLIQAQLGEITEALEGYIEQYASSRNYHLSGDVRIYAYCGETREGELLRVIAQFYAPRQQRATEDSSATRTAVFDKALNVDANTSRISTAEITCRRGRDEGKKLTIGSGRINIGRWDKSDFRLNDNTASRLHAYIVYSEGRHILYDAESANGTYVNDKRIAFKALDDRDEIRLGNSVLVYHKK